MKQRLGNMKSRLKFAVQCKKAVCTFRKKTGEIPDFDEPLFAARYAEMLHAQGEEAAERWRDTFLEYC
jgi:hypothetical protein